jgi:FKBP-type peptidyl-prolyl cis-trans isomerase FkpA
MKLKLPLVAAFVAVIGLTACGGGGGSTGGSGTVVENAPAFKMTETLAGTGAVAASGTIPTIKYTGWLYSSTAAGNKGTQFGSGTINSPGTPAQDLIKLGTNSLIAGFEQGVTGMKVGAKRTLVVPSSLGYGAAGSPPNIPGNTGLVFDVELTAVN